MQSPPREVGPRHHHHAAGRGDSRHLPLAMCDRRGRSEHPTHPARRRPRPLNERNDRYCKSLYQKAVTSGQGSKRNTNKLSGHEDKLSDRRFYQRILKRPNKPLVKGQPQNLVAIRLRIRRHRREFTCSRFNIRATHTHVRQLNAVARM